jgi:hypothetical protein
VTRQDFLNGTGMVWKSWLAGGGVAFDFDPSRVGGSLFCDDATLGCKQRPPPPQQQRYQACALEYDLGCSSGPCQAVRVPLATSRRLTYLLCQPFERSVGEPDPMQQHGSPTECKSPPSHAAAGNRSRHRLQQEASSSWAAETPVAAGGGGKAATGKTPMPLCEHASNVAQCENDLRKKCGCLRDDCACLSCKDCGMASLAKGWLEDLDGFDPGGSTFKCDAHYATPSCTLLTGWKKALQPVLAMFGLASLLIKKKLEERRSGVARPYRIWVLDVGKQAMSGCAAHFAGLL